MEAEAKAKTPNTPNYHPASEREKTDRDRQPPRTKELARVWSSERDDLLAQSPAEYDSKLRMTDRSNPNTTRHRKPQKSVDVQAGPEGEPFQNDFDPVREEGFASSTPKTHQSNSFNAVDLDPADPQDDGDYRGPGSIKNPSRVLNAAKYIFTRDTKSRSNNQKSSRSANTKLSAGPAIASIKKFLQNSTSKTPGSSNNSFTKSFEEAPSVKTLSFSGVGDSRDQRELREQREQRELREPREPREPRAPPSEQISAFKKPSKDFLFTRGTKTGGTFSGYNLTPPEERGNAPRGDN